MAIIAYYGDSTIYGYNGQTTTTSTLPRPTITDGSEPQSKIGDLIFSDEFQGGSLDTTKWTNHQTFWQDISGLPQHYDLSNGALRMWLVHTSGGNGSRGVVNTEKKFNFRYVFIEVEAQLGWGTGHWPGIWTYSSDHSRAPAHEEIDIMEAYPGGNADNGGQEWGDAQARAVDYEATFWLPNSSNTGNVKQGSQRLRYTPGFGPQPLSTTFNKYGLLWEPNALSFYFNGRRFYRLTTGTNQITTHHHMCLQEWAGSSSGTPTSSVLGSTYASHYRYCRIWGLTSGSTSTTGTLASASASARIDPLSGTGGTTIPVGGRVTNPSPAVFQSELPQHTVQNYGINSTDTAQLIAGTNGFARSWSAEMAQSSAEVVIISFGINDQYRMTLQQYKDNLTSIYNTAVAQTPPKRVIFQTPNPTNSGVETMVTAMKEVAATLNVPVIDVWQYMTDYIEDNNGSLLTYIPDGLHPNQSTYTLIGEYAALRYTELDTGTDPGTISEEVFADRIMETTTSTGTGALMLGGAVTAYRTFASVCQPGSKFYGGVVAVDDLGNETGDWEMGQYTYNSDNSVSRIEVHSSSDGSVAVHFPAGTKRVFMTLTAAKARLYVKNTVVTPPAPTTPPASSTVKPLFNGTTAQQDAFYAQFTDQPVLQDEFDGSGLDLSKWFKGMWYDRTPNDNNMALVNGKLQLYPTGTNVSVTSNETFLYGYFEAKMRLCRGTRTWPAFWLIHAASFEPPEIDIMEAYPGGPYERTVPYNDPIYGCGAGNCDFVLHPHGHNDVGLAHYKHRDDTLSTAYHTWGCHWRKDGHADFYFDGNLVFSPRTDTITVPMYLVFDIWFANALGPYENREWRRENPFEIEYCRVWGVK